MKIAHIADCHLGLGYPGPDPISRFEDIRRVMDWCADKMIEEEVDMCLFAGDAFKDSRVMLDRAYVEIAAFAEWMGKLTSNGIHAVIISGTLSHDAISVYKILERLTAEDWDIVVATEPLVIEGARWGTFNDGAFSDGTYPVNIICLPGLSRSALCAREEYQSKNPQEIHAIMSDKLADITQGQLASLSSPERVNILLSHFTYSGADTGFEHLLMEHEPLLTPAAVEGFDLVCLGHIHGAQQILGKPIFYAGSPERLSFNEENQKKGFWIHEIDNANPKGGINSRFIETPARKFMSLDAYNEDSVKDAIVRMEIKVMDGDEKYLDRREVEKKLYAAAPSSCRTSTSKPPALIEHATGK